MSKNYLTKQSERKELLKESTEFLWDLTIDFFLIIM